MIKTTFTNPSQPPYWYYIPASVILRGPANHSDWLAAIEKVVRDNHLERYLTIDPKKPVSVRTDDFPTAWTTVLKEWKGGDARLQVAILMNMKEDLIDVVRGKDAAVEMLAVLNEKFGSGSSREVVEARKL